MATALTCMVNVLNKIYYDHVKELCVNTSLKNALQSVISYFQNVICVCIIALWTVKKSRRVYGCMYVGMHVQTLAQWVVLVCR